MMMIEARSRAAKKNLQAGIKKMQKRMTRAAQVRRDFRLGRNPKTVEDMLPIHPTVVWKRATEALSSFRARMTVPKLDPNDVTAVIVFIELADPDQPHFLLLEEEIGTPCERCKQEVFKQLSRGDVIALGMIFRQFDEDSKEQSTFPYVFTGLNGRGIAVLEKAVELQKKSAVLTKDVN